MKFFSTETIVAPATPLGEGGIGIVRLSGPLTQEILSRVFSPSKVTGSLDSHRLYHGYIRDLSGIQIDEVMVVLMRAPRSYTREDVGEIHCHGGLRIIRKLIDLLIECGARLSRPGEFTLRAFLNGRLDLTQAEAVADHISAHSEAASRVAFQQMEGSLYRKLEGYTLITREILAKLEAYIDFPEEDLPINLLEELYDSASALLSDMEHLVSTFDTGRIFRDGLSLVLLGRPNVGKSSLLNALLGEERVIVTDIPGTTRDIIEEQMQIKGIPLRLVDTAGIHESDNPIEAEGIRRAKSKINSTDIVLFVIDTSQPLTKDDFVAAEICSSRKSLLVMNKSDIDIHQPLLPPLDSMDTISVSALTGFGVDALKDRIADILLGDQTGSVSFESVYITRGRHRDALLRAIAALREFMRSFKGGCHLEFLATDLRELLQALGEITGETTPDDILNSIFSQFCIGK